jgi:hypothetical protein
VERRKGFSANLLDCNGIWTTKTQSHEHEQEQGESVHRCACACVGGSVCVSAYCLSMFVTVEAVRGGWCRFVRVCKSLCVQLCEAYEQLCRACAQLRERAASCFVLNALNESRYVSHVRKCVLR